MMERIVMEKEEVKILIWRLDSALATFSGVDWMENVGRIARLKERYFHCTAANFRSLPLVDREALDRCLELLDHGRASARARAAAFDMAAGFIAALLPDNAAQAS